MNKKDLLNYCQLAFINGVNDAISVIMLHKVFVVLMTGNIIYSMTALATGFHFSDLVRISLIFNFIISGIIVHTIIVKKSVHFRIILTLVFVVLYLSSGVTALHDNLLGEDSIWFLIIANIATTMSVITNNIFYRINSTKFNLVAYTMNLLNLAHMIGEKRFTDAKLLSITIISFAIGLLIASFLTIHWHFYTILITIPVLAHLFITNYDQINKKID